MISQLKALAHMLLMSARALFRYLTGRLSIYPEFGAQTVDEDDVSTAKSLVNHPEIWDNEEPIVRFEKAFSEWNGSLGARSFMGGRVALSAAIYALQLKPGDEVVVPGYTCVVVPNAFKFAGITVKYCDIELDTFGPDHDSLKRAISSKTRAVLVHHLYGLVARDLEKILDLARSKGLYVIEDCAHSTGASLHGRKVGNFGDVVFYSTEQSKVFSTFNGGIAATNNPDILERLAAYQNTALYPSKDRTGNLLRNFIYCYQLQKSSWRCLTSESIRFRHNKQMLQSTTDDEMKGLMPIHYGQKMPPPLAELALMQLKKVDVYNQRRRAGAEYWMKLCHEKGYTLPMVVTGSVPVFLRYPVMVPIGKKRDVEWCIREFGVRQGLWFLGELHPIAQPMAECPNARKAVERCINLPTLGISP